MLKVEEKEEYYSTNNVAGIIKIISIILAIIGVIGIILCIIFNEYIKIDMIVWIIDFIVLAVFIYGFGELIGIMHDIRTNTEHLRDYIESEKK